MDCGNPALCRSISSKDFRWQCHVLITGLGGNLQDAVAKGYTSMGSAIYMLLQHFYRVGDTMPSKRFGLNGQNASMFMDKINTG